MLFSIPNKLKHILIVFFCSAFLSILLSGCGGHVYHRVERGETLYSIGWIYGYDYRQIAQWNNINPPYILSPGKTLRVVPPSGFAAKPLQEFRADALTPQADTTGSGSSSNNIPTKTSAPVVEAVNPTAKVVDKSIYVKNKSKDSYGNDAKNVIDAAKTAVNKLFYQRKNQNAPQAKPQKLVWRWPVKQRRLLRTFLAKDPSRQGLDLAGERGSPVFAAAKGRVVYAGSGLVQYGRLIIIKHDENFLSAYAHNQELHVKEGESVKLGQRIADMGRTGNLGEKMENGNRAKLHFEIRHNGKPVNPSGYLPK